MNKDNSQLDQMFQSVAYTQCQCGLPGCCIRVAKDKEEDGGGIWLAMYSHPRSLWERIKIAWAALLGKDAHWTEVNLTATQYWELVHYVYNDIKTDSNTPSVV